MIGLTALGSRRLFRLAFMVFCFLVSTTLQASLEEVRLRLVWKNQFQFAGYYIAKEKGFYEQEGLKVEILEKDHNIDNVQEVLSGKAQFSVGRSSMLLNRARGDDVVALFSAFQQSPMMLLTLKESGISTPDLLRKKRIMFSAEGKHVSEIVAMLIKSGISQTDYIHQMHSFNLDDLIDGNTDAMAAYISNEPYQLEKRGYEFNIIHPKDYGFDMYSDILFTSGKMIRERPQLVERFFHASMRGWLYAFEHIDEAASIIVNKYNTQNRSMDALLYEANALKSIAFDENGKFGTLDIARIKQMVQIYVLTNILDKLVSMDGFMYNHPVSKFRLSAKELGYISTKNSINMCVTEHWMPYEGFSDGGHKGMVADYLKLVQEKIGITFNIIPAKSKLHAKRLLLSNKCEAISSEIQTVSGSRNFEYTTPYLAIPASFAHDSSNTFNNEIPSPVVVIGGTAFEDIVKQRHPRVRILTVENGLQGLNFIKDGKAKGMMCTGAHINSLISEHNIKNITVDETIHDVLDVGMAVKKGNLLLAGLLDKAIRSITEEEKQVITSRWINIKPAPTINPELISKLLVGFGVVLLIAVYSYYMIWRHNRKLSEIADTDWLTKIPNRHRIIRKLEEFINHSKRYDRDVSLIYFDIDDFKHINDKYGHDMGDKVLKKLAKLIESQTRKTDISGRWGGEEFILVSPEAGEKESMQLASKLRRLVETTDFGLPVTITCSFGVAQYRENESMDSLIKRADEALYKAKNSGKNIVVAYEAG